MRALLLLTLAACGSKSDPQGTHSVDPSGSTADPTQTVIAPAFTEDRLIAGPEPVQDILFVVDNSRTMGDAQAQLDLDGSALLVPLLDAGIDFHVAVTSTDSGLGGRACQTPASASGALEGRLVENGGAFWVDATTPAPAVDFGMRVQLGTNGSGCEMGIATAYQALEVKPKAGFLRDDAALHVVVMSDEQDHSEDWGANLITLRAFEAFLLGLRPTTTFSSIVCTAVEAGCAEGSQGSRYLDVTDTVGGLSWPITDVPYDAFLDQLGALLTETRAAYALGSLPDTATLVVELERDGVVLGVDPSAYAYDAESNTIVFDAPAVTLQDGDVVLIRYQPAT